MLHAGVNKYKIKIAKSHKKEIEKKKENTNKIKSIPPEYDRVYNFFQEKEYPKEARKFYDFYDSKNWYVGKNKMKKWKSAASGWINRLKEKQEKEKPKIELEGIYG